MFSVVKKMFSGNPLKKYEETVQKINSLEPEMESLHDEELGGASLELKRRLAEGESEEELIPRAFALVREAGRRALQQRLFDVQLVGGLVLRRGGVAEMATGEGKTLAGVAPSYMNALKGGGVHVVTVNEYLARRDAVWMGQIYRTLGLSVACLVPGAAYLYDPLYKAPEEGTPRMSAPSPRESALLDKERDETGSFIVQQEFLRPVSRREAYLADVTYGTNHEFGFDYLRDNLAYRLEDQVQRGHTFALIDEVDSILIDEARTPLIIAAPDAESSEYYKTFARIVRALAPEEDYTVDEKMKAVSITQAGIEKVEKIVNVGNLYAPENLRLVRYLEESLRARGLFHRDKDYVVKDGEVYIVDEFTGRILHGRRYNGGLHQAIEAKENVDVKQESRTYAKISIQNYFRLYTTIAGMTGTAQTSAEEFFKVYNLEVASIPTNKPICRADAADVIYRNTKAKMRAVVADIQERHAKGQPILIGTPSIEKNELVSSYLTREGIPHEVLNAKNNEREGAIIAQAGRKGAVTVATNMAGRGVDIILGGNPPVPEEAVAVREAGGLHVVGTERHEARRIDNQLRGRAGRQGDPGSSQFFLSLEDDLLRVFGGDRIKNMMERFNLPENEPVKVAFVSKAVAQAQARVEGMNFDVRKHLLEYDDVLNKQRGAVYKKRQEIISAMNPDALADIVFAAAKSHAEILEHALEARYAETGEAQPALLENMYKDAQIANDAHPYPGGDPAAREELLRVRSTEAARHPQALLQTIGILDLLWMNNLEDLDALSESVRLRAYGQRDPLVEYRQEASKLFRDFWANFNGWIFSNIFRLTEQSQTNTDGMQTNAEIIQRQSAPHERQPALAGDKIGRNDPCWCGSGKKYKKCHGA